MSWADLDKISIARPRPDGRPTLVVNDDRPINAVGQAKPMTTVMAIARVARARRVVDEKHGGKGVVVYGCRGVPPVFLIDAVTAAGGVVFDGNREHTSPRPPSASVQLDGAFSDLGTEVRRRMKAPDFGFALDMLEARVRRDQPGLAWPTIFELMALAGELLREVRFGRWVLAPAQRVPFALDLGVEGQVFPAQIAQTIAEGGTGSLRALQPLAKDPMPVRLPEPPRAAPVSAMKGRLMPLLCDRAAVEVDRIAWQTLVDAEEDTPTMPIVAWVEDRGETLRWPARAEITAEHEARALANVDALALTIAPLDVPGIKAVTATGDYFAAEAILSPATMARVREQLGGARTMLVGTPARGHLIAMDAASALVDEVVMNAFLIAVERAQLAAPERDRITSEVTIFADRPIGRVQSDLLDVRRALREVGIDPDAPDDFEPAPEPAPAAKPAPPKPEGTP